MRSSLLRTQTFILAAALVGCGGGVSSSGAFELGYPDNDSGSLSRALARVGDAPGDATGSVGVALTSDNHHLVGFDTATGRSLYRVDVDTTVPVVATGSYVLVEESGRVRVFDLANGRARTTVSLSTGVSGEHLIGADADGDRLAISISTATGTTARSRLVLVQGDAVDEDVAIDRPLGVPAIAGTSVLVPWAYQFLSVMDFGGNELARVRVRNGVVSHAIAENGRAWYGSAALHSLDATSATETPTGYAPPDLGIDRPPTLLVSAYDAPAPVASATHHVKLVFAVDPASHGPTPTPADGLLYLVYFRFVFALDANDATPRWVRSLPGDIVGANAFPGGIRLAAETGDVVTLSATDGRAHAAASIGESIAYAAYPRVASMALPDPVETERPDVRAQLVEAVQLSDARLVAPREFALARLAALPDDDATSDLTLLCEDARLPPRTKQRACDLLATRPVGSEHILAQLARHGSFLEERSTPPVAALARAAGNMHVAASVPLLIEQLRDPRTPIEAIAPIADACGAIGDASAAPALLAFLRTYHADNSEVGMTDALGAVANAYARLGGADALTQIDELATDQLAPIPVARALRDVTNRARIAARTPQTTTTTQTATTNTTPTTQLPTHLTLELANPVLEPAHADLLACIRTDPARPAAVRVIIVARRDGTVAEVHASPDGAASCIREAILPLHFPATRGTGTARVTITLHAR